MIQKQNIFLTGGWGYGNLGDDAILLSTLESIRRNLPESRVYLTSYRPHETRFHLGVESAPSLHRLLAFESPRIVRKLALVVTWLLGRKLGLGCNIFRYGQLGETLSLMRNSDIVVLGGGGYFNDLWIKALHARLLEIWLAKAMGKKIIIYGQTVGPFNTLFSRLFFHRFINMVDIICYRDKQSSLTLEKHRFPPSRARWTADEANLLDLVVDRKEIYERYGIDSNRLIIGVVVQHFRPYESIHGTLPYDQIRSQTEYLLHLKRAILQLKDDTGATIVLLPSTSWDIPTAKQLFEDIAKESLENIHLIEGVRIRDYIGLCQNVDFMLSTNMHPLIFATTNSVPSCAISYYYKVDDFMASIGLAENVIRIDSATTEAILKICSAVLENRDAYKTKLDQSTEPVREKAKNNVAELLSLLSAPVTKATR